jgi:hypothetical protein
MKSSHILITLVLLSASILHAAPANDTCSNAITVFPDETFDGTTIGATGISFTSCGYGNDTLDVWNRYTPETAAFYAVSLLGSPFDTTLSVFNTCGGYELACNDQFNYTSQYALVAEMSAETPYYIRTAGYNAATGNYRLLITKFLEARSPVENSVVGGHVFFDGTTHCFEGVPAHYKVDYMAVGGPRGDRQGKVRGQLLFTHR